MSKSKLCYDRRSAGQSVLESSIHLGLTTRSLLHVWQLWVCWFGAPFLMRGRVCRLQLLLALASAIILGFESRGTHYHILLKRYNWDSRTTNKKKQNGHYCINICFYSFFCCIATCFDPFPGSSSVLFLVTRLTTKVNNTLNRNTETSAKKR
jgi:hypothetical protein